MSDFGAALGFMKAITRSFVSESFEGQIVDTEGQPFVDAYVYFDEVCSTKSALSGRFSVELKAGTYSVSVMYHNIRIDNIDRVVISGSTDELKLIKLDRALFEPSLTQQAAPQQAQEMIEPPPQASADESELISVNVRDVKISGKTVYELYRNTLTHLVEQRLMRDELIPWGTGTKRYLIAKSPVHPSEKEFVRACEVAGYYVECNKSRQAAPGDMQRFINALLES